MSNRVLIGCLLVIISIANLHAYDPNLDVCDGLKPGDSLEEAWTIFKAVHKRQYSSAQEEHERWAIFEKNARAVIAHNEEFRLGRSTYTQACNKFADLRPDEIYYGYKRPGKSV